MDSRIREIEQRLARAKEGLSEGGREDYLNQLYLLDAEIKAVIKDNGVLPHTPTKKPRQNNKRNFAAPVLRFAMSFGAIILSATITYSAFHFASANSSSGNSAVKASVSSGVISAANLVSLPVTADEEMQTPEPLIDPKPVVTAHIDPSGSVEMMASNAPEQIEEVCSQPKASIGSDEVKSSVPTTQTETSAPQIVAANIVPPMEDTPVHKAGGGAKAASSGGSPAGADGNQTGSDKEGFNWTVARFAIPGEAKKTQIEETEDVNQLKNTLSDSAESSE